MKKKIGASLLTAMAVVGFTLLLVSPYYFVQALEYILPCKEDVICIYTENAPGDIAIKYMLGIVIYLIAGLVITLFYLVIVGSYTSITKYLTAPDHEDTN